MSLYEIKSVISTLEWCCNPTILFIQDGWVIGHQTNPNNDLTREWFDESDFYSFDPEDWTSVTDLD